MIWPVSKQLQFQAVPEITQASDAVESLWISEQELFSLQTCRCPASQYCFTVQTHRQILVNFATV